MKEQVFDAVSAIYELHEKDIKEYSVIKGRGMKFNVRVYDAAAAGNLCVMDMRAFCGLMRMETVVFSPTDVDGRTAHKRRSCGKSVQKDDRTRKNGSIP